MGEIGGMMLDGTLCEGCGEWLGGGGDGYPVFCSGCGGDESYHDRLDNILTPRPTRGKKNTPCPTCGKKFRGQLGVDHHMRDKHGQE